MIFVEKGVEDKEGITDRITDYILFDIENLADYENDIRNALRKF